MGYGNVNDIGDNEHPVVAGTVSMAGAAISVSAGFDHTCAVISAGTYQVRCWGHDIGGVLGRAEVENIGDDELPSSVVPVVVE